MRHHIAGIALAVLLPHAMRAQSAVRFVAPYDFTKGLNDLGVANIQYGLGFDHDLNDHLAFGADVIYRVEGTSKWSGIGRPPSDLSGWDVQYRSYYLLGDHERTSFYMGSWIGVRTTKYVIGQTLSNGSYVRDEGSTISVPVGVRIGMRGGLEGFFGDLFVAFGYAIGGSVPTERYGMDGFIREPLSGPEFRAGLNFGIGWE